MAGTGTLPAAAGRTIAVSASPTIKDATYQTTQWRTPSSSINAVTQSRSPQSLDVRRASSAPQLALPLPPAPTKRRKRTSGGGIGDMARGSIPLSEGEAEDSVEVGIEATRDRRAPADKGRP